jgi:hypothetical protein
MSSAPRTRRRGRQLHDTGTRRGLTGEGATRSARRGRAPRRRGAPRPARRHRCSARVDGDAAPGLPGTATEVTSGWAESPPEKGGGRCGFGRAAPRRSAPPPHRGSRGLAAADACSSSGILRPRPWRCRRDEPSRAAPGEMPTSRVAASFSRGPASLHAPRRAGTQRRLLVFHRAGQPPRHAGRAAELCPCSRLRA